MYVSDITDDSNCEKITIQVIDDGNHNIEINSENFIFINPE